MKRSLSVYNLLSFLLIFFVSCGFCQTKKIVRVEELPKFSLQILCEHTYVEKDSIHFRVKYVNIGKDGFLLPYYRLDKSPFFELIVVESTFCCGIHSHYNIPSEIVESKPCLSEDLDNSKYKFLNPADTLVIDYNLNEIGYYSREELEKGKEYTYYIKLSIPKEFKNVCSNMWTGHIRSNYGSFIVK